MSGGVLSSNPIGASGLLRFAEAALQVRGIDCSTAPGVCRIPAADGAEITCDADSDCLYFPSSSDGCARTAVALEAGATLDLGGHVLTGGGVRCGSRGSCTVRNGEIAGAAVGVLARSKVAVEQLSVHDSAISCIESERTVRAAGVDVANCALSGIFGRRGVQATASSATGCLAAGFDSSIGRFKGIDIVASGNRHGVDGSSVSVRNLTAQGNTEVGVITARNMTLIDSNVTGNGLGNGGRDIESQEGHIRPRNTVCDHSNGLGLCAID